MKITKEELLDMGASEPFLERYLKQVNFSQAESNVADLVGGENTYDDLLWLAWKKISRIRLVRLACDCALLNIEEIKPYTDKFDLILTFLRNPSAADADDAARSAGVAARSAADDDAAARSAISAIRAAYAAADDNGDIVYWNIAAGASAGAGAAYWASKVSKESKQKVDNLLVEMFNEIE